MQIITSVKSVGGSRVIILPREVKDYIGDDVLVSVTFKKYTSTRQEQFNKYQETQKQVVISFNNTKIKGSIITCDAEKVRFRDEYSKEIYIVYYKDIENVELP